MSLYTVPVWYYPYSTIIPFLPFSGSILIIYKVRKNWRFFYSIGNGSICNSGMDEYMISDFDASFWYAPNEFIEGWVFSAGFTRPYHVFSYLLKVRPETIGTGEVRVCLHLSLTPSSTSTHPSGWLGMSIRLPTSSPQDRQTYIWKSFPKQCGHLASLYGFIGFL